jgi:uncharacterized membrane protein YGL010W
MILGLWIIRSWNLSHSAIQRPPANPEIYAIVLAVIASSVFLAYFMLRFLDWLFGVMLMFLAGCRSWIRSATLKKFREREVSVPTTFISRPRQKQRRGDSQPPAAAKSEPTRPGRLRISLGALNFRGSRVRKATIVVAVLAGLFEIFVIRLRGEELALMLGIIAALAFAVFFINGRKRRQ